MNPWWWVLLALLLAILLVAAAARRRNKAQITTRMFGRVARIGTLAVRTGMRRLAYAIRRLVSSRKRRKELKESYKLKTAEEAAQLMGQMKGVFMKLGQIVSFADDALGESAQEALRTLQQSAPPMSFELFKGVVES